LHDQLNPKQKQLLQVEEMQRSDWFILPERAQVCCAPSCEFDEK